MLEFSIVAYIAIAAWFIFGDEKSQRNSTTVGVCLSGFLAVWYWAENNLAMAIYIILGLVCVFLHWISAAPQSETALVRRKSKIEAAVLAFVLGMYGVHKFYLRKSTLGLLYVLFFWTGIPWALGLVEAVYLLFMKQTKFDELYNGGKSPVLPKFLLRIRPRKKKPNTYSEFDDIPTRKGVNERDGDQLNYRDIRVGGYQAEAVGVKEDFVIIIKANGNTYKFVAKNGIICSCKSSSMRGTKHYEVT